MGFRLKILLISICDLFSITISLFKLILPRLYLSFKYSNLIDNSQIMSPIEYLMPT